MAVVLVHGLTFGRRIWQPVMDRLGDSVTSLAVGLPAHGESKGQPAPVQEAADQVHSLVQAPGREPPIVAGHSSAVAAAGERAAGYPARGIVITGQATERPGAFIEHCNRPGNGA
jgi:pimeloyl-ACP methyl ester carboxylesterase